MDFQQIYELYDYYRRMFIHYDYIWQAIDSEEFYLANEFYLLMNYFKQALNDF